MSTLTLEALATAVKFDARQIGVPLAYFPRLANASAAQRKKYVVSGGGIGLHWEELDEDISVPALLAGRVDRTATKRKPVKEAA